MSPVRALTGFCISVASLFCVSTAASAQNSLLGLDEYIDNAIAAWKVPGLARRDPYLGKAFVTFAIGPRGKVDGLRITDWAEFRRDPERVPSP